MWGGSVEQQAERRADGYAEEQTFFFVFQKGIATDSRLAQPITVDI